MSKACSQSFWNSIIECVTVHHQFSSDSFAYISAPLKKESALKRQKTSKPIASKLKQPQSKAKSKVSPPPSPHEESIWNTPAAAARPLRFTDNLLIDEEPDLNDVSASFMSPPPPSPSIRKRAPSAHWVLDDSSPVLNVGRSDPSAVNFDTEESAVPDEGDVSIDNDENDDEEEDEKTIVLKRPSPKPQPVEEPQSPPPAAAEPASPALVNATDSPRTKRSRVRITNEVERIVVGPPHACSKPSNCLDHLQTKIWSTVGDIIMPGHPFDISGSSGSGKYPPRAKETM